MATLEYIDFKPERPEFAPGVVRWVPDKAIRSVVRMPQIMWESGEPWREANQWALEMARRRHVSLSTAVCYMRHLHKYCCWLEQSVPGVDWRHFPQLKSERVLVRFRGYLVDQRDSGKLNPSTATAWMNTVIRFYRFAEEENLIGRHGTKREDLMLLRSMKSGLGVGQQYTLRPTSKDVRHILCQREGK